MASPHTPHPFIRFLDAPNNADLREDMAAGNFETMIGIIDRIDTRLAGERDDTVSEHNITGLCLIINDKCLF